MIFRPKKNTLTFTIDTMKNEILALSVVQLLSIMEALAIISLSISINGQDMIDTLTYFLY